MNARHPSLLAGRRRMGRTFEFSDYGPPEIAKIFRSHVRKQGFRIAPELLRDQCKQLEEMIQKHISGALFLQACAKCFPHECCEPIYGTTAEDTTPPVCCLRRDTALTFVVFHRLCRVRSTAAKISQDNGGVAEAMFDLAKLELDKENDVIASATLQARRDPQKRIFSRAWLLESRVARFPCSVIKFFYARDYSGASRCGCLRRDRSRRGPPARNAGGDLVNCRAQQHQE